MNRFPRNFKAFVTLFAFLESLGTFAAGSASEVDSLRIEARIASDEGRLEQTVSILERILDTDDAEPGDYILLGNSFIDLGKQREARRAFDRAVKMGAAAEGYVGIGLIYRDLRGDKKQALRYFDRAIDKDPDFAEAYYHYGLVALDMRTEESLGAFLKATEADSLHRDAYFQIGLLYEEAGEAKDALGAFRRQVVANPSHSRSRAMVGKMQFELGMREEALEIFQAMMDATEPFTESDYLEMAEINQKARNFDVSQFFYESHINLLPEEERFKFLDISLVATFEELQVYEAATEKKEFANRFWNRIDPAPLTRSNERLLEHYRRVAYSREHFSRGGSEWDDRGDVYIRYGDPDHISRSGDIRTEQERYVKDARDNFVNRKRIALQALPGMPIFPVESDVKWEYWIYADVGGGIEITYVNQFMNGRYRFAQVPPGLSVSLASSLMEYQGFRVVQDAAVHQPSLYRVDFADLPIDFYYYSAGYRGDSDITRLEVYYGLPASEVSRLSVDSKTDLVILDRGLTIFDEKWNEVKRINDQLTFSSPTDLQIQEGAFIPGELIFSVPPGEYLMAFQIRDVISGKSQIYQKEIVLEDYSSGDDLKISDIELAFLISETSDPGPFIKQGLKVIPMASKAFRNDQNAYVYFEIYNLTRDAFGQSSYRVEYSFRAREKRGVPARVIQGLGKLFRTSEKDREIVIAYDQSGDMDSAVAYVELALAESDPGGQEVSVKVTDLLTAKSASKEIAFQIDP